MPYSFITMGHFLFYMTIKISASLLSSDYCNLESEINKLNKTSVDYIHFDIMDGSFVPEITFGANFVKSLRKLTDKTFDVHLMVENPEKFIERFASSGSNIITVHMESTNHIDRLVSYIKSFGVKAGVSICPGTGESSLKYIYDIADLILVMSVNPGFGGQKFIHSQLKKISSISKCIKETGRDIELSVDGGITNETGKLCVEAGANILVSGSYIFGSDDYSSNIDILKNINS